MTHSYRLDGMACHSMLTSAMLTDLLFWPSWINRVLSSGINDWRQHRKNSKFVVKFCDDF